MVRDVGKVIADHARQLAAAQQRQDQAKRELIGEQRSLIRRPIAYR